MPTRRTLLAASGLAASGLAATGLAAMGAGLALPSVARAAGSGVMKFIPQSDLTVLDPVWTTAYVTRNHALMVFDTLYGIDAAYAAQPQMVAGHSVEQDGRRWRMTLRPGLRFHDGTPVLARDCVASIQRWSKRDAARPSPPTPTSCRRPMTARSCSGSSGRWPCCQRCWARWAAASAPSCRSGWPGPTRSPR
jgi:ABC-type transport system substrate-binding protein